MGQLTAALVNAILSFEVAVTDAEAVSAMIPARFAVNAGDYLVAAALSKKASVRL
jgi:hypothetical protein